MRAGEQGDLLQFTLEPGGRAQSTAPGTPPLAVQAIRASLSGMKLALLASVLLSVACNHGGGGERPAPEDLTGTWIGNWKSRTVHASGALTITITQSGTSLEGGALFQSQCLFGHGDLFGFYSGGHFSADVDWYGFTSVSVDGIARGARMVGVYDVLHDSPGGCEGDVGTFTLTRSVLDEGQDSDAGVPVLLLEDDGQGERLVGRGAIEVPR